MNIIHDIVEENELEFVQTGQTYFGIDMNTAWNLYEQKKEHLYRQIKDVAIPEACVMLERLNIEVWKTYFKK